MVSELTTLVPRSVRIPLASSEHAIIVKRVIDVDKELQSHVVKRTLDVEAETLVA